MLFSVTVYINLTDVYVYSMNVVLFRVVMRLHKCLICELDNCFLLLQLMLNSWSV